MSNKNNNKLKAQLYDIIKLFFGDKNRYSNSTATGTATPKKTADTSYYGVVRAVNSDGSYNVQLDGSDDTVKCDKLVGANVGDTVLTIIQQSGHPVVAATVGGDRDALNAQDDINNLNQYFWHKQTGGTSDIPTGSYVTEVPQEEFTDPTNPNYCSGGNLLLQSNRIRLRMAAITLAELMTNSTESGLNIYEPTDAANPVASFLNTGVNIGKLSQIHWKYTSSGMFMYKENATEPTVALKPISGSGLGWDMVTSSKDPWGEYTNYAEIRGISDGNGHGDLSFQSQRQNRVVQSRWNSSSVDMEGGNIYVNGFSNEQDTQGNIVPPMMWLGLGVDIDDSKGTITFNENKMFKTYTATVTDNIGGTDAWTTKVFQCTGTVPTGYTPIAIQRIDNSANNNIYMLQEYNLYPDSGNVSIRMLKRTSGSALITVSARVLCVRTGLI